MDAHVCPATGTGLIRALVLTWLSVVMSACGHSITTGASPSSGAMLAGTAAVALLLAPLTRRRTTAWVNSSLLAALQVGLHMFFTVTMPAVSTGATGHSMTVHGDMAPASWATVVPSAPMLCGHLISAAGAAWLLRGGDLAMARVFELAGTVGANAVRLVREALRAGLVCCAASSEPATLLSHSRSGRLPSSGCAHALLVHEVTRRGPPGGIAAPG
ncbi:hypothetical protein I3215_08665 [Streptomyces sp. RB110-1]|uniref:hypothetical protein n=1 Tax=unclassified Streptomyces TaxID=2593676 RepID=UPI001901F30D|nr:MULTISPECIES: hypothetical protein [unclassified Streptomyces]MBK0372964.1 hypothetical protein [Streptomyces sp. RB110-1]MBK0390668.1 hypothetical protein [Streptomyces sp. RB110-2]